MEETNKSQMLSEAELIEAINANTLVSISLGKGQPQKNVTLSTLATVVAGIINPMFCRLTHNADFNTAIDGGEYSIADPNKTLGNNPGIRYGVLVTFEADSGYRMQLALDSDGGIWMRFFNTSPTSYKNWKVISYS